VEIDCDFSHDPLALPSLLSAARTTTWSLARATCPAVTFHNGRCHGECCRAEGINTLRSCWASGWPTRRPATASTPRTCWNRSTFDPSSDGYGFQIEMTYRARRAGASIIEVPISFTDREHGESKMSQAIVIEALWLVTKWAIERPFASATGSARTAKAL